MMSETHVVVLWEFARAKEREIVEEISRSLDVVASLDLSWPIDPVEGFKRFYGAKLKTSKGKVESCGGGPFRLIVVRDLDPQYGMRETSRGVERVNANMFDLKGRCRAITGGGHKVHATNSPEEARRDIYLLTGHAMKEWTSDSIPTDASPLPGCTGWRSLRELFTALEETSDYVVLRNFEMLPDGFDPTLHGDIDLLVRDEKEVAGILSARKVYDVPYRVHYEITVGGKPVRLDLRHVGDDYYCRKWEDDILARRRRLPSGVWVPSPEDAFHSLVYHAVIQKLFVAPDYPGKIAALAAECGISERGFDGWLVQLRAFMSRNGYVVTRAVDKTVKYNVVFAEGEVLARRAEHLSGVRILRQIGAGAPSGNFTLPTAIFEGEFNGVPCYVKYAVKGWTTMRNEWWLAACVSKLIPDNCVKPLFWHQDGNGGGVAILEKLKGRTLRQILDSGEPIRPAIASAMAKDMTRISDAMADAGIVHRDLRPSNFIVTDEGHVSVIDFQYAIERSAKTESTALAERHAELLSHLGGDSAVSDGIWNDRLAVAKCISALPEFPGKSDAIAALESSAKESEYVACLPIAMRRDILRLRWKLRIKRWLGKFTGKRLTKKEMRIERHVVHVLTKWRFA